MKAAIVAAGMGTRLLPLSEHVPKCLVPVNGKPIMSYQLDALLQNGVTEVVIVVGHLQDQIKDYTQVNYGDKIDFQYVINADYAQSQNAYSLWLARDLLCDDPEGFLVFNSDLVFEANFLSTLINHPAPDGMIIDVPKDVTNDMVKIALEGDRIIAMSKQMDVSLVDAEAVGPVKFSQAGAMKYFDFLAQEFIEHGIKNWLFYTLGDFGRQYPFVGIRNPGLVWAEIDNLADHAEAEEKFPRSVKATAT